MTLTQNDIPLRRDSAWPEVPDLDAYQAATENVVSVERWEIDTDSLRFTELSLQSC